MPDKRQNPYTPPVDDKTPILHHGKKEREPIGWWWPFVISLAFTPGALLANVSYGSAHGDNILDTITDGTMFPLAEALAKLAGSNKLEEIFVLLQFPLYGAVLSLCSWKNRFRLGCGIIAACHVVSYIYIRFT